MHGLGEAGGRPQGAARTWVVVLERALGPGEPLGVDAETVRALLEALSDLHPVALCQPDRYALQVRLTADGPMAAVNQALARHDQAVRRVPLGGELVRIELLTAEEFEGEWSRFADSDEGQAALQALSGDAGDPVADAAAALESIAGPKDAQRVLIRLVRRLGGGVVAARLQDEWTLPLDISFGVGPPQVPIAEPWSMARLRLEQELPAMVDTATRTLGRLAARPDPHGGHASGAGGAGITNRSDAD